MASRTEPVLGGTEINDSLLRDFTTESLCGYARIFPEGYGPGRTGKGYLLPNNMIGLEKRIRELEMRPDDILVASYPKTGTTWTQEMVWCIDNDLDFERAKSTNIEVRFPFLEMAGLLNSADPQGVEDLRNDNTPFGKYMKDSVKFTEEMESPRYIKTHLPWELLPEQVTSRKPKIIYVYRNPKDTCVSYYHHAGIVMGYRGSFDDFVELFLHDALPYGPYWDNMLSFLEHRDDSNLLIIRYEDMIKDLPSVIRKVSSFLGKKQLNDGDMKRLCDHLSFKSMKSNRSVNYEDYLDFRRKTFGSSIGDKHFMRKGKMNSWKEELSPEQSELIDEWTKRSYEGAQLLFD